MRNMSLFFIIQDIILWLLMIGVIVGIVYLIVKFVGSILSIPERKRKAEYRKREDEELHKNQQNLINEIYQQASRDRWWAISSQIGKGNHASVFIHRYDGSTERFGFREHGYDYLTQDGMINLYKSLEFKTLGKLHFSYREIGGYSDTVTSFSEGFTPGGGTGYYANTVGGGSSSILEGITLNSPEYEQQLYDEKIRKMEEEKRYKKTF